MSQSRQAHPISQGDYEQFKTNPVFKRFLHDIEDALLGNMDRIGSFSTVEENAMHAVTYREAMANLEFIKDWIPEELSTEEE